MSGPDNAVMEGGGFRLLPDRVGDAARQMALDYLLFQWMGRVEKGRGPVRMRRLVWREPALTFGYRQKREEVEAERCRRGADAPEDICRRFTGGGVVFHGEDLTWALLLPARLALTEQPAPLIYRWLHERLRESMEEEGRRVSVHLPAPSADGPTAPRAACFQGPEEGDLVLMETGEKVAGAAMKRGKQGLLWQGTLQLPPFPQIDGESLTIRFGENLARHLGEDFGLDDFPAWAEEAEEEMAQQLSSEEWLNKR